MITDTAPYRYPHYHTVHDTPDRVRYAQFAEVVAALITVTTQLGEDERRFRRATFLR
jgi:hypothetical protein